MHVMLDLETLGVTVGKAIVEIGAVPFDYDAVVQGMKKPYSAVNTDKAFSRSVRLDEHNMDFDRATLAWWLRQPNSERVSAAIEHGESLQDALQDFIRWCNVTGITHVWAKPSSFDIAMIEDAMTRFSLNIPWKYNCGRDCRTLFEMWALLMGKEPGSIPDFDWEGSGMTPHVAWCDAAGQAYQTVDAIEDIMRIKNGK